MLLTAVALPAIWVDRNIVQEQGFVALAGPLGSDQAFQSGLVSALSSTAKAQLNLPPGLDNLAAGLIQTAATSVTTDPGYPQAWTQTLQQSHQVNFGDTSTETLALDVAPLLKLVAARVSADLPVYVPINTPSQVLVSLGDPGLRQYVTVVSKIGQAGYWLGGAAVVLLLLGLAVARKRGTTAIMAAVGLALVALVWKIAEMVVIGMVERTPTGNAVADVFSTQLTTLAEVSVDRWILIAFIVAGSLFLVGILARVLEMGSTRRM
jgi:hypothetical protein